jgi:hypothetical protein
MLARDYIQRFCAVSDIRYYFLRPTRQNGMLWATNGHIIIQAPDDDVVEAMGDSPLPKRFRTLFEKTLTQVGPTEPLSVELPSPTVCTYCGGSKEVSACLSCPSQSDRHLFCVSCDLRDDPMNIQCEPCEPCHECNGTGEGFLAVAVGKSFFQRRYLALLMKLGPVSIALNENPLGAAIFYSPAGHGLLMPCKATELDESGFFKVTR